MSLEELLENLKNKDQKAIAALKEAVQDAVKAYHAKLYPAARPIIRYESSETQSFETREEISRADILLEKFNTEMNASGTCNILQEYAETPNKAVEGSDRGWFPGDPSLSKLIATKLGAAEGSNYKQVLIDVSKAIKTNKFTEQFSNLEKRLQACKYKNDPTMEDFIKTKKAVIESNSDKVTPSEKQKIIDELNTTVKGLEAVQTQQSLILSASRDLKYKPFGIFSSKSSKIDAAMINIPIVKRAEALAKTNSQDGKTLYQAMAQHRTPGKKGTATSNPAETFSEYKRQLDVMKEGQAVAKKQGQEQGQKQGRSTPPS